MANEESEIRIIRPQEGFQENFVRSNIDVVIGGGVLNPQPMDALISTPDGFRKMGDIKVGDIIHNPMGGNQVVNFVIDKGLQDVVEFTLQDGRKVQSALSHRWMVKERHGNIIDISSEDIIKYIDKSKNRDKRHVNRLRIPLTQPVSFYKKDNLKIHPYLLGCLIGDGCLSNKLHRADLACHSKDYQTIERIKGLGYDIVKESKNKNSLHYCIRNKEVVEYLKELGLWGKLSYDKFIPNIYKYSSIEDRMELLRGLFDTDGCCYQSNANRRSRVSYRTTSERLAKDIQELIWSIGGRCSIHITDKTKRIQNGKEVNCAKSYGLLVWTKDDKDLFCLDRKKNKAITEKDRKCNTMLSIMDYKLVGKKNVRCINVSGNEHIYLTDGYVITRNCGKSFAAILSVAEPSLDPNFRACFTRRTFSELKGGGSLTDDFKSAYGNHIEVKSTDPPRVRFPSGAFVDFRQINDENIRKVTETWKGSQYDLIYMDELTSYEFSTFKYLLSRNRGKAKWSGKFRGTTNPEKDCWVRKFIDWYVGLDGQIMEDRNGVVRYFYLQGENVDDVVWGDSKEEVYRKCRDDIDRKIKSLGGGFTYQNLIKSFTFYLGRMSENKASIGNNMDYAGSVAAVGGRQAQQLIEGNWNVSLKNDAETPIPYATAESVFNNDPRKNNDKWITADLADTGDDNTVILVWNGLHIIDYKILCTSTPRLNAEMLMQMAERHGIPDNHIIYDAIRAAYINDYINGAIGFKSYNRPNGLYWRMHYNMKDECYGRLVEVIKRGLLSFEDSIAEAIYPHKRMSNPITIKTEFIEECSVVRWKGLPSGKKTLFNKKEMNQMLGKNRSMDLLDPIAMRMLPLLKYEYGQELIASEVALEEDNDLGLDKANVFDDSFWS